MRAARDRFHLSGVMKAGLLAVGQPLNGLL
jgi:hypothetical protein